MTTRHAQPCGHWDGAVGHYCHNAETRRYLDGWRCNEHTPAMLGGRTEAPGTTT